MGAGFVPPLGRRPFFGGYTAFAVLYLVLVLRLIFIVDTWQIPSLCDIGIGFGFLTAVACHWLARWTEGGQAP
jgi:hypothetical protein